LLSRGPHRTLATVQCLPNYVGKDAGEEVSEKKRRKILVLCAIVRQLETAIVDDTILHDAVALKVQIAMDSYAVWTSKSGKRWIFGKSFVKLQPGVCPAAGGFQLAERKFKS
jgi:hypothetical protein